MAFEEIKKGFDEYMQSTHTREELRREITLHVLRTGDFIVGGPVNYPVKHLHIPFVTPVWDKDFYQHMTGSQPQFIKLPRGFQKYRALWEYLKNNPNTFIW